MEYFVVSVGNGHMQLLAVKNNVIINFFKTEKRLFTEKITELGPELIKKLETKIGYSGEVGVAHVFKVMSLAGEQKNIEVFNFASRLQKKLSCQYLVGRQFN
jgi:hypothetical protein